MVTLTALDALDLLASAGVGTLLGLTAGLLMLLISRVCWRAQP